MMVDFAEGVENLRSVRSKKMWRRASVGIPMLCILAGLGVSFSPFLVLGSSLRDGALEDAVNQSGWHVESGSASGGWFQPISFFDVRISDADGRFECHVSEVRTNSSLIDFISGGPERQKITLVEPQTEIRIAKDGQWPKCSSSGSGMALDFSIEDGSLRVIVPSRSVPIVEVDSCDLRGSVGADENGVSWLNVEPFQVLDRRNLTDAETRHQLALIAPLLSQTTKVSGSVSLSLDQVQIPLDGRQGSAFPIRGRAEIHSLEARLKTGWARQISLMLGSLSGAEVPDQISMLEKTNINFKVIDNGIQHEATAFLFPQISPEFRVVTSGTVHFDETLDLTLSVFLPTELQEKQSALAFLRSFSTSPIPLAVTGTVSSPSVGFPERFDVLSEISRRVTPAQYTEEPPGVPTAVSVLLQGVIRSEPSGVKSKKRLAGSILNLIRAVDKERK